MRTIRSNREIDAIFKEGKRVAHPLVVALVRPTPAERGPEGRVAFVAGRKIGGAVQRNRARRTMKGALLRLGLSWAGHDVALVARPATGTAPPGDLEHALRSTLRRGGVTR